ncbi:NAD-dependent epimerase/dehydratase family protein [Radiobacillus deserti]|uniref:NAD-dependent epimerase/dehydratase family protein n=1 Tax=Radiobacillus deserti TaxID=2594883 RepID=A0A516KC55_9BACI|nr:NAD-dependent epimerase/dehydratase family protein [Radiobacillus deserti]QDP38975.1 NAD-dependent epimerase/dehydratase family protein [Radiobacillus deserti]
MKTALILGGTQFVGKRLVSLLIEKNVHVTIATRGITPDSFGDSVDRIIITREDRASMESAFQGKRWDVVFDQTCYSSQEALDTREILKDKIGKYIFTSSQAVYANGTKHKEEDFNPFSFHALLKPRSAYKGYVGYQEAKRAAEAVLFQQETFPVVAVRFPIEEKTIIRSG